MAEKKMKKCRNCSKDVAVEDEESINFVHDCGWSESKARAEARRKKLMGEVEEEITKPEKKDRDKGIFGW
jgi:G:T-mismatch repair DNA endonuclease (very short patch repair protein)